MKKRSRKEYIVIGLGRFGTSIAKQLEANGCMVLAIDNNEQKIRQIAEYVTLAMCLDVSNEEALEEIGGQFRRRRYLHRARSGRRGACHHLGQGAGHRPDYRQGLQ